MFSAGVHLTKNQKNYKLNASNHSEIGLSSTLFLAYRDLPGLLERNYFLENQKNRYRLLDFGCGAGLSTEIISKMIKKIKCEVEIYGVDINEENLNIARKKIPHGRFYKVDPFKSIGWLGSFDIIICNFVLLEHPYTEMLSILNQLRPILHDSGMLLVTNCTSKAYKRQNQWHSFNSNFPENIPTIVRNGKLKLEEDQPVKVQIRDYKTGSSFSFFDFYHSGRAYREAYQTTGFILKDTHKPLGQNKDEIAWKDEARCSPYKIHILKKDNLFQKNLTHIRSSL